MKQTLLKLAVIALLLSTLFVFASCAAKPELDLKKAEKALEDEDYEALYHFDNKDDDFIRNFEQLGIYGVKEGLIAMEENTALYDYTDILKTDFLIIVTFDTDKQAQTYYDFVKRTYDNIIDEFDAFTKLMDGILENCEDELDSRAEDTLEDTIKESDKLAEKAKDVTHGKSGKTVWIGTKGAIENTKN